MSRQRVSLCSATVMDDTDPDITFDDQGVCNHVHLARERLAAECFRGPEGELSLKGVVEQIKAEGRGKPYDCVLGLSGGVDSSYTALRAKELGLRPLVVHLDNGWNSEVAVANIEMILRKLDLDLYTYVVDWEEIKDLQRAFFKASVANVEVVTDHAILAILFKEARRQNIRFIVNGSNVESESIMPDSWGYDARDARHIRSIHKLFGYLDSLKSYPLLEPLEFLWYVLIKRIRFLPLLNYGRYNKKSAIERLQAEFGWTPYPRKHGESRFTRFFQEHYLPEKFGFDKRKAHLSSLIVAGQMSRENAFAELNKPLYQPDERAIDVEYVIKKLGFSPAEWEGIMSAPIQTYATFFNNAWMFDRDRLLTKLIRRVAKGEFSLFPRGRHTMEEQSG